MPNTSSLTIARPDDWHVHLRDGAALATTVAHSAAQFGRILAMPNLQPPITTTAQALAYRERIMAHCPPELQSRFQAVMSLYLTDHLAPSEIAVAKAAGIPAAKLYPAGATTNSDAGVTNIRRIYGVLEAMQKNGMLLLLHGEVTNPSIDIFDREARFIEQVLIPLRADFPELKIVLEHITTQEAAQYVETASPGLAASITAHHLLYNRNALFQGGLRPHYYCLPVLKREHHRQALIRVATSGNPRFFLGSDSAPHAALLKESASGCAGCYTAPVAMELYAEAFASANALDRLEAFAAFHGADFYGLPRADPVQNSITLVQQAWEVPADYPLGPAKVKPLCAGLTLAWRLQS